MRLYRPVGLKELRLIAGAGFRAFPPRLPSQPIFYPVMSIEYAREIAVAWNANDAAAEFVGFVTQFDVDDEFASRYPAKTVGAGRHKELWVPAAELAEFNQNLLGPIVVVEAHPGERFAGVIEPGTNLPLGLTVS